MDFARKSGHRHLSLIAVGPSRLSSGGHLSGRHVRDCGPIEAQARSIPWSVAALADLRLFKQARIELGAVTWPNGADLDPFWMYGGIAEADNNTWLVPF